MLFTGTCKVRSEIETKRNEINENETKRKRNEINKNETKRNQRNENETNEINELLSTDLTLLLWFPNLKEATK
jgi:hypothetical protein